MTPSLRLLLLLLIAVPAAAAAQPPAGDPIRCWWRTSQGAVATGEPFTVVLTCSVREDASLRALVDETRLGPEAIQLAPFEVMGGAHPPDLRRDGRRLFQYDYTVRIIDADLIGRDVRLPDVGIEYRVGDGRARVYTLQGLPVRVLSLVPADARDIRDSGGEDFARVATLRFRARALQLVAAALALLGVALVVPALVRATRRAPATAAASPAHHVPPATVLRGAAEHLAEVQQQSRGGWTPDLAHRTASALRLAAAGVLASPISQRIARDGDADVHRLVIHHGWLRRRPVSVASTLTTADLQRAIDALPETTSPAHRQALDDLRGSLAALTAALYRPSFDAGALDAALADGTAAAQRLAAERRRWRR